MENYLPPTLQQNQVVARIGLISDTHMPERCPALPSSLFDVLDGVDLLLHAGDVGELWVLDHLSTHLRATAPAVAVPVIAVHGNDESQDARRELPYQQLINVAGQRILLWHSHYPDNIDERLSRTEEILPKLQRSVDRAKRAGAKIVIFGHWHIPLVYTKDGVTVINPGAIASGNAFTRQLRQTVAILFLCADGQFVVTHVDLAEPSKPFVPEIDFDAGFSAALRQVSTSIIAPELRPHLLHLRKFAEEIIPPRAIKATVAIFNRAAQRCWAGEQEFICIEDWINGLQQVDELPTDVKEKLIAEIEKFRP